MTCQCPRCGADRIATKGFARRAVCAIGTIAGAVGGATGAAIRGVAGAIVGALVGGAAGGSAGATLGEIVDENVLDNFVCLTCEFSFGKTSGEAVEAPFYES